MNGTRQCIFLVLLLMQIEFTIFYFLVMHGAHSQVRIIIDDETNPESPDTSEFLNEANSTGVVAFNKSLNRLRDYLKESTYRYDRARELALMQLTAKQMNSTFRTALGRKWLKSQRLVVAASVRNAMYGLESSVNVIRQLSDLFHSVTAVFVENDSLDQTRSYLHELSKQSSAKFKLYLLGCGTVNSAEPCHLNISYGSSGRQHRSGHREQAGRSLEEESVDRGLVMAALRNMYLSFIYANIHADMLLVLESDLPWVPWSMDSVAQGLYYFKVKPQLDSLCALTSSTSDDILHDPCTLIFHHKKQFYVDATENSGPFIDRIGRFNSVYKAVIVPAASRTDKHAPLEPLKVASCFQGVAFYRMSSLRASSAFYRYSEGEWQCEHSTLSMQLRENYLDTQMRLLYLNHLSG